jgi:hypothetical protein
MIKRMISSKIFVRQALGLSIAALAASALAPSALAQLHTLSKEEMIK